jgi:hypothetical protein
MTVTLNLAPEIERSLREKAAQSGLTLEAYVQRLVERDMQAAHGRTKTASADQVALAEGDRRLEELSEGLAAPPTLPADRSRANLHLQGERAFCRDLPELLQRHEGQWVAYRGAQRLGLADSSAALYQKYLEQGLDPQDLFIELIHPEAASNAFSCTAEGG